MTEGKGAKGKAKIYLTRDLGTGTDIPTVDGWYWASHVRGGYDTCPVYFQPRPESDQRSPNAYVAGTKLDARDFDWHELCERCPEATRVEASITAVLYTLFGFLLLIAARHFWHEFLVWALYMVTGVTAMVFGVCFAFKAIGEVDDE